MFSNRYIELQQKVDNEIEDYSSIIDNRPGVTQDELFQHCSEREARINRLINEINLEFKKDNLLQNEKDKLLKKLIIPLYEKQLWIGRHVSSYWEPYSLYAHTMANRESDIENLIKELNKLKVDYYAEMVQQNSVFCSEANYISIIESINTVKVLHAAKCCVIL